MKKQSIKANTSNRSLEPSAGGKHSVSIAGRSYPIVRGSIRMKTEEAGKINLTEFPSGSIVDFTEDDRPGMRMHALQNITPTGAEVVVLYRLTLGDTNLPFSLRVSGEMMKRLLATRQTQKKDLVFLTDEIDESHFMVAGSVKAQGQTVDDVFQYAKQVLEETLQPFRLLIEDVRKQIDAL